MRPGIRAVDAAQQREQRRLAGAVRADDAAQLAARDVEADVVGRDDAAEPLGKALGRKVGSPSVSARGNGGAPAAARQVARQRDDDALREEHHDHDQQRADDHQRVLVARPTTGSSSASSARRCDGATANRLSRPPTATQMTGSGGLQQADLRRRDVVAPLHVEQARDAGENRRQDEDRRAGGRGCRSRAAPCAAGPRGSPASPCRRCELTSRRQPR